jgi:hypothetical protein
MAGVRVYVGGIAPDTQESELEDTFSKFGRVQSAWVARNPAGKRDQGASATRG